MQTSQSSIKRFKINYMANFVPFLWTTLYNAADFFTVQTPLH